MDTKRIAIMATTGSAAFLFGFAAVGLVALAADTVTEVIAETTRIEQAVEPVHVEPQVAMTPEPSPEAEVVNEWPSPTEYEISDGTYDADDFKRPRKFRDIESFTFEMYDYDKQLEDGSYGVPIPPKGTVKIGTVNYKLVRISLGKHDRLPNRRAKWRELSVYREVQQLRLLRNRRGATGCGWTDDQAGQ